MNNIYYSRVNKKIYIGIVFTLIGLALIFTQNVFLLLIDLLFIVFLYDGILSRDFIVLDDKKKYIAIRKGNVLFGSINLVLLMIVFSLSINRLYIISLALLYLTFLELSIANILISNSQKKLMSNKKVVDDIIDNKNSKYNYYEIEGIDDDGKGRYILTLCDTDSSEKISINYSLDKYLINYKEFINLFENEKSSKND